MDALTRMGLPHCLSSEAKMLGKAKSSSTPRYAFLKDGQNLTKPRTCLNKDENVQDDVPFTCSKDRVSVSVLIIQCPFGPFPPKFTRETGNGSVRGGGFVE